MLARVHSECLTGDVFGSRRCDCGAQLDAAMAAIAAEGRGVVLYLRGHEGRGIGLLSKLRPTTCRTPARTRWTPTSSSACPPTPASTPPARRYSPTSGVRSVRLLTNNPAKVGRAVRLRDRGHRHGAAAGPRRPRRTSATSPPSGTGSGTSIDEPCPPNGDGHPSPTGGLAEAGERRRAPWCGRRVDAAGLSLAIAATRWHAEITDTLVRARGGRGGRLRRRRAAGRAGGRRGGAAGGRGGAGRPPRRGGLPRAR